MSKVKLYIARHGKTMFNTIGRAQGWSDSPLTPFGEEGIRELGLGLKAAGIPFKAAYSSDSGRTIQTMDIILRETGLETIPYKRIPSSPNGVKGLSDQPCARPMVLNIVLPCLAIYNLTLLIAPLLSVIFEFIIAQIPSTI